MTRGFWFVRLPDIEQFDVGGYKNSDIRLRGESRSRETSQCPAIMLGMELAEISLIHEGTIFRAA